MKLVVLAAGALILSAAAANANCSTANLAGTWTMYNGTISCGITISTAGAVTGCYAGTIAMSSTCRWSATMGTEKWTGRGETISTTSSAKPNFFQGIHKVDPMHGNPIIAYRN